ncbi:MAG: hypothetical protein WBN13_13900 [Robiginitalea sp.]|uniref:hypothetical protein n=1 Tax=Robiginitalea sp. TaxID=1902411 RepID=UPI003C793DA2
MGAAFLSSWDSWLLLADALMAGMILAVQWVVYPAFQYFSKDALTRWHSVYTRNITALVAPLMVTQLLGGVYWSTTHPGLIPLLYTFIVCVLWGITFLFFVPLHRQISLGIADSTDLRRLIRLNGLRTVLWLIVLALHLIAHTPRA